ncbi:MAG: STAS/SEC14 domain-containing protein [Chryseolinea sp.]
MIELIQNMPPDVAGFRATGKVTKDDYDKVVFPEVEQLVKRTGHLNYLMIIDTDFENFTLGAWWKDTILSLMKPGKRQRTAIITPSNGANKFTDNWGKVVAGEFKGFLPDEEKEALAWLVS